MKTVPIKEVAKRLDKSLGWVYLNAMALGGTKIGGSWIFTEEGLENALLRQEQKEVEGQGDGEWSNFIRPVPHKKRGKGLGGRGKEAAKAKDQHNLLGPGRKRVS
jgi:hypothetical protein